MKLKAAALRRLWESRAPRERKVIAVLAALLGAAAYVFLVHSTDRGREQLRASVAMLRTQAALLDQQAAEHQRLRAAPAAPASSTDLRTLVQARTDAARLSGAMTRIDAPDVDHVNIAFGALAFADWLAWTAALEAQQVRVESARVEALAAAGMVSATATLTRARAQ
jgi:general secretion pathway protein M